jgi:hypothetical protein
MTEESRLNEFCSYSPDMEVEGGSKEQKIWRKKIEEAMAPKRIKAP